MEFAFDRFGTKASVARTAAALTATNLAFWCESVKSGFHRFVATGSKAFQNGTCEIRISQFLDFKGQGIHICEIRISQFGNILAPSWAHLRDSEDVSRLLEFGS